MNSHGLILLVDGQTEERALGALVLRQGLPGIEVEEIGDPMSLAERLVSEELIAVVTESALPWTSGLDLLETAKRLRPGCPVLFFTGVGDEQIAADGIRRGLDGYVVKGPAGYLALAGAVRDAVERATERRRDTGGSRYRTLVREMPVGAFTAAQDGTILEANPATALIVGIKAPGAIAGANLPSLLAEPGRSEVRSLFERGLAVRNLEVQVRGGEGAPTWVRLSAWPAHEGERSLWHWEGCVEEISSYKTAERELSERAAALARSNAELQQFSYVISHDLQEPLQLISRYAQMIAERWAATLETDAQRYLAHVMTAAARMQAMINDVLEYARVETRGRPFASVDTENVVAEALAGLKTVVDEAGARVEQHGLPTLVADRGQLIQVFQNLISNAVKFRSKAAPRVQVSAVETEDSWVFACMDNGIGIPQPDLERIFGMFQRLHTAAEVPGTGIGLAICKRIVERHGGQIWATSTPGESSTFYFSIPKQLPIAAANANEITHGEEHGRRRTTRLAR